ncbi:MAG TPA: HAD hydrolase family protein [Burkholderiales bacterium]|jgi:3-deoxy-D-manno-octulosonate 8-phosphate phosphatase (KDO 8-P phosphatase)|nr:HAD hydrolase family protein [Burkholderiales bacterium]
MPAATADALERARRVRLMVFDVDGVLTDGRLWYGPQGEALKAFHTLDGHGLKMLAQSGIPAAILSGRSSPAVALRAAELGVAHVVQGAQDKAAGFATLLARLGLAPAEAGCMGDDVPDLPVLERCGFACAPREAHESVRRAVHYVATAPAGAGAAREVCEYLLRAQGKLEAALARHLA